MHRSPRHIVRSPARRPRLVGVLGALVALAACDDAASTPTLEVEDPTCPQTVDDPPFEIEPTRAQTTSSQLAVRNLDAQIAGYESLLRVSPGDVTRARPVVDLRLTRSQFIGLASDLDATLEITERVVAANPDAGAAHLLRARVLSAVHRWDAALAALDAALALGADATDVQRTRDAIDLGTGRGDKRAILARAEAWAATAPSLASHAARANALWQLGRYDEADAAFQEAMASYRDVAPWIVAWSDFQRGLMWSESANRPDLAEPLYRAAVERLPQYHVAVVHYSELLAEGGGLDEAIALLEGVVATAEDPEAMGFLATLLDEAGDAEAAATLRAQAKAQYEALLATHREAYAEHATEFFLNVVEDPALALDLALGNLADRPNTGAYELAVDAALAAGDDALACSLIERARREATPSPVFCEAMHAASAVCR